MPREYADRHIRRNPPPRDSDFKPTWATWPMQRRRILARLRALLRARK